MNNPNDLDLETPHPARVYDFLLGGKDNYEADRRFAQRLIEECPDLHVQELARENRKFLHRSVGFIARELGIHQFLDLGTGLPTSPNLHEVAQGIAPEARVVYVDNDPLVLTHARALLASSPEGATDYIPADVREVDEIVEKASRTLDFGKPVAVSALAILHFVEEAEPAMARLRDRLARGSCLTISHGTYGLAQVAAMYQQEMGKGTPRHADEIGALFGDFELVEPGLINPFAWRPDSPPGDRPTAGLFLCGVGRRR
ncbi:SAM-dependent methyltransferase [Actinomadura viridis]|uniref:SAM-dependent methyltransferase n=1 Tax=Actinomadura viridis TaxID=58110 RepID=UPI0036832A10